MNILEVEDMIKGMPDNALMQEAQRPTGQVPQFLVVSELQRRGDMRKRYQAQQQQPQATVKDQIVMESMGAAQPQGIMAAQPQMAPQQAPQQMFSGGIIRLAEGGKLQGFVENAKELAREFGITVADAMERLSQQAQMNMPNYSMIAPSGIGDLPSMSDIGAAAAEYGDKARQGISDAASKVALNAQMNMPNYDMLLGPSGGESKIMSGIAGIGDALSDSYSKEQGRINQGITDGSIYAQSPVGESKIMSSIAGIPDAISSIGDTLSDSYNKEQARINQGIMDGSIYAQSPVIAALERKPNPQTVDTNDDDADPTIPELTEALEVAKRGSATLDASSGIAKAMKDAATRKGGANVQGDSDIQTQATGLDLSDLIAESRKDALSAALVQLGSGIAGGDVSKGISAAGQALTKGQQEAKAIAMKGRLAEYQATRQDLAREEKARQFNALFEQADRKIAAEVKKAERVNKGQLLSFVSDLVKEAAPEFLPEGQSREAVIQQLTQQLITKYAPFLDVDIGTLAMDAGSAGSVSGGMSQSGWGISGR